MLSPLTRFSSMMPRRFRGRAALPALAAICFAALPAFAQDGAVTAPPPSGVWQLFRQSFDLFTILLLLGSVSAGAFIFRSVVEIRGTTILPPGRVRTLHEMIEAKRFRELRNFVDADQSFPSRSLRAAFEQGGDRESMREAAELAASEQVAGWFRKIEPLNIIGNLGPLVGLAGTVWGMILAFSELGRAGGEADPAALSEGISKALFHTLLGLCLAIPCLLVFGFYRSIIDRHCTRAMVIAAELVEKLPETEAPQKPVKKH